MDGPKDRTSDNLTCCKTRDRAGRPWLLSLSVTLYWHDWMNGWVQMISLNIYIIRCTQPFLNRQLIYSAITYPINCCLDRADDLSGRLGPRYTKPGQQAEKNRARHKYKKKMAMTDCLIILHPAWKKSVVAIFCLYLWWAWFFFRLQSGLSISWALVSRRSFSSVRLLYKCTT